MVGPYWIPEREPLISKLKEMITTTVMGEGYDIIVDNMNLNPKEVAFWKHIVEGWNNIVDKDSVFNKYRIEFKDFFDVSVEDCIKRDAGRQHPIGEQVIRDTWNKYKFFIQTTQVEKLVNNLRIHDEYKNRCIVVDMDSTLCFNTQKRPWFGEGSTEAMINDVPNQDVVDIIKALKDKFHIVIGTGRDTSQQEVTERWLNKHDIHFDACYFRTNGDYRKGVEVKKEQINKILKKYDVVAIFDDCEPIVQMYRDMGLTVLQPNKGL